jgi:hypothetical protein
MSYVPIALYAESLRINSALVYAIGSRLSIPLPLTGCIKDLSRIWHISPSDVLSDFKSSQSSVASLRHGNSLPLVNKAILERAGLIGRKSYPVDAENDWRTMTVNLTYLYPLGSIPLRSGQILVSRIITAAEIVALTTIAVLSYFSKLYIGAGLVLCLAVNIILQILLSHFSTTPFAKQSNIASDVAITSKRGAASDVHVIVEHWNASEIDVLVGYSAQLHALTNISVRIRCWWVVSWVSRAMILVLVVQAAALTSLMGAKNEQALGSLIWLACYLFMLVPPALMARSNPDMLIGSQRAAPVRVPPIHFTGRKPALAFISTLPVTGFVEGRWDWVDNFLPRNQRRKEWEKVMRLPAWEEPGVEENWILALALRCRRWTA